MSVVSNRDGVIIIGNNNIVKSTINSNPDAQNKAISILTEMEELAKELENANIKGDLLDDIDTLKKEIVSQTPDNSKIERAVRRVGNILEPIKHITTVTTLLIHLKTLLPVISTIVGSAP